MKTVKKKGREKRKRDETGSYEQEIQFDEDQTPGAGPSSQQAFYPQLLDQGIFEGTGASSLFLPPPDEEVDDVNIDPSLLAIQNAQPQLQSQTNLTGDTPTNATNANGTNTFDETANTILTEEVTTFLNTSQGSQLASALNEAEDRRLAHIEPTDELLGLDEDELDRFILSEEEVRIKERIWVEINKDYLEALAGMCIEVYMLLYCIFDEVETTQRKWRYSEIRMKSKDLARFVPHSLHFFDRHILIFFISSLSICLNRDVNNNKSHAIPRLLLAQPPPNP